MVCEVTFSCFFPNICGNNFVRFFNPATLKRMKQMNKKVITTCLPLAVLLQRLPRLTGLLYIPPQYSKESDQ